jgi:hypothetical protein
MFFSTDKKDIVHHDRATFNNERYKEGLAYLLEAVYLNCP